MENPIPLCILIVSPKGPTQHHKDLFDQHPLCDLYFVTHDKPSNVEKGNLGFYPKTSWAETRNILYKKVPKNYQYYMFTDYDIIFESKTLKCVVDQLIEDLTTLKPAILIPYYRYDDPQLKFLGKKPHSHQAFTNNCVKIVHESLLDWFFPMSIQYGGTWDAAHYFNILEIPFYGHVLTTHLIIMDNPIHEAIWNSAQSSHTSAMSKMWNNVKTKLHAKIIPLNSRLLESNNPMEIKSHWKRFIKQERSQDPKENFSHLTDILHQLVE